MKKITLLALIIGLISQLGISQSYSIDFDQFEAEELISESDENWIALNGADSDASISSDQSNSGDNSLYFGTATELDFINGIFITGEAVALSTPEVYSTGVFDVSLDLFVESGKGGSISVTGSLLEATDGISILFNQDQQLTFRSIAGGSITTPFVANSWNNIRLEGSLNFDSWNIFLNDQSLGTLEVENTLVSALTFISENPDYEGGNGIPGFYIDNVSYAYEELETLQLDAAVFSVLGENFGISSDHSTAGITGQNKTPEVVFINLGLDEINSVTTEWVYGGQNGTLTFENLNLNSGEKFQGALPDINLLEGENTLQVIISDVNGQGEDDNSENNSNSEVFLAATPNPEKMVLIEEATGTWCGACPAGTVVMDYFFEDYQEYISGIAVHGGDIMEVENYPTSINAQAYPTIKTDRGDWKLIYEAEHELINQLATPVNGTFELSSSYENDEFTVNVTLNALSTLDGYRLGVILTEDNVTGTTQAYDQANGYSGSSNTYGGFETLPTPVTASEMVYDHVARATLNGALGSELPVVSAGDSFSESFTYSVSADQDPLEMKAIAVLYRPDGIADNSKTIDLSTIVSVADIEKENSFRLFPNPASSQVKIVLDDNTNDAEIQIMNLSGQVILEDFSQGSSSMITIDTSNFPTGIYFIKVRNQDGFRTEKLIINK